MPEKLIIQPHFRLQKWVAQKTAGQIHDRGAKVGAYQSLEAGRASDVSCTCHWTVNVAASTRHGKLYSAA